MTTTADPSKVTTTGPARKPLGQELVKIMTTTDHKLIGKLYLITSFAWFLLAGLMALVIRSELAFPGSQVVNEELYNQLFTMHGTIMLLLFATPLFFGFANVIMPIQIGSPDVAFPRLNMFSYWLFLFGGNFIGNFSFAGSLKPVFQEVFGQIHLRVFQEIIFNVMIKEVICFTFIVLADRFFHFGFERFFIGD